MSLDSRYNSRNYVSDKEAETRLRLFGWKCFYCKEKTKEQNCPTCSRSRKDAELGYEG